jgi:hypothetical protein
LIRGIPVTTAARTAFELGRRYGVTLAVIRLDALMQATDVKTVDVDGLIDRHRGSRGIVQLREAIGLVDAGAESPQETRTRLVLTAAGLRPQRTQIDVFDRFADHVGRIDMGWDDWKVGVEYDGELGALPSQAGGPPACGGIERIRNAGRATSIARPNCKRSVGQSPASAPTFCRDSRPICRQQVHVRR